VVAHGRLDLVEELVHALLQPCVLEHQRIADHHTGHARILLGKLQHHGDDPRDQSRAGFGIAGGCGLPPFGDLVDEGEDALLDELDQAFEHLRLAGEMAVQGGFADAQAGRQRGRSDAVCAGLLQHLGQCLQDLDAPLARLGSLACDDRWVARRVGICEAGQGVWHGVRQVDFLFSHTAP
jgi:hypothetical protein